MKDTFAEVYDARGRRLTFPREVVSQTVEESMDKLCEMIDLTLRNDGMDYLGARSQIYLTGGGIAMMRGAREYLAEKIGKPVKATVSKTATMNSPVYSSMLGLLDITFDSIERSDKENEGVGRKLSGLFRKSR